MAKKKTKSKAPKSIEPEPELQATKPWVDDHPQLKALHAALLEAEGVVSVARDLGLSLVNKTSAEQAVQSIAAFAQQMLDTAIMIAMPHKIEFGFMDRNLYYEVPKNSRAEVDAGLKLAAPFMIATEWWDTSTLCTSVAEHYLADGYYNAKGPTPEEFARTADGTERYLPYAVGAPSAVRIGRSSHDTWRDEREEK